MRRFIPLALVFLSSGCSSGERPMEDARAVRRLKAQAAEVGRAMIEEDHPRLADLCHPAIQNMAGGRDGLIKHLGQEASQLRQQGLKFHELRFNTPSRLIESGGVVHTVYPYSLELTGPKGESASQPAYLIGTSNDGGENWRFLDGAGIKGDRKRLKRLVPTFPDALDLPPDRPLVIGR